MVVIGIQNQPGTTLMTVSDLSAIDAEVKVAEADVLRLALGQRADVVLEAIPGRKFPGRVVEIGASALPVVGTQAAAREFKVVVRLDQADASLRPGLTCDATILTEERQNVLTTPLQSVVLRPSGTAPPGRRRDLGPRRRVRRQRRPRDVPARHDGHHRRPGDRGDGRAGRRHRGDRAVPGPARAAGRRRSVCSRDAPRAALSGGAEGPPASSSARLARAQTASHHRW